MTNPSIVSSRLWWKEARQLLPLVALLLGLGVFLHLIFLLGEGDTQVGHMIVFVGMPGLFAVGAGVLLIGQEKELRTLGWLSSLPIHKPDLVRVKLLVCLFGLLSVWLASLLLTAMATAGEVFRTYRSDAWLYADDRLAVFTWPLHTVFVLLSGIAIAWRLRSSLVGLLVLIPVALLPAVAASVFTTITSNAGLPNSFPWNYLESPTSSTLLVFQFIGCIAALGLGWRHGLRALGPVTVGKAGRPSRELENSLARGPRSVSYSPFSALLWQSFQQNKHVTLGCSALALAAMGILLGALSSQDAPNGGWLFPAGLMAYASASWLGVSVFASDRLYDRIRFLADRGISSRTAWFTRHAVPALTVGVLCLVTVVLTVMFQRSAVQSTATITAFTGLLLGIAIFVYAISQWVGQLVTSPIVAGIAAPAISFAALAFDSFAYEMLGAPLWLLAACTAIPFLITYVLSKRWMEGKLDRYFWISQIFAVVVFLIVPAAPFAYAWTTTPGMTQPTRLALEAEIAQSRIGYQNANQTELILNNDAQAVVALSSLRQQLDKNPGPIQVSRRIVDLIRFQLQTERMELTAIREKQGAAEESAVEESGQNSDVIRRRILARHRKMAMELTTQIVARLRVSPRLIDQDTADDLEITLVNELRILPLAPGPDSDSTALIYEQLADHSGRNMARRRAVAFSWQVFIQSLKSRGGGTQLGGYPVDNEPTTNLQRLVLHRRRVERAVETLWDYANATAEDTVTAREKLAEFWNVPQAYYGLGPTGRYFRADDLDTWLPELPSEYRFDPASQWHADWEEQALELGEKQR